MQQSSLDDERMVLKGSSVTSALRVLFTGATRRRCWSGGSYAHFATRTNQQLACEYDALIGGDAFSHHNSVALALAQFYGAKLSCIVRFHYIDIRPLLADLCRLIGD